jgi:hypothetical protein
VCIQRAIPISKVTASLRDLRILLIGKWTRPYGQEALVVTVEAEIAAISVIL